MPNPMRITSIETKAMKVRFEGNAANASKIAQMCTEDTLVLYPDHPAVKGRSAIGDSFKEFFTDFPQNEFQLSSAEIEIASP